MFGKKKIESDEETVALSQAEVDRLLKKEGRNTFFFIKKCLRLINKYLL